MKQKFLTLWEINNDLKRKNYQKRVRNSKSGWLHDTFNRLWVWLIALLNIITDNKAFKLLVWIFKNKKEEIFASTDFDYESDFQSYSLSFYVEILRSIFSVQKTTSCKLIGFV
jgi:hypothetical protein